MPPASRVAALLAAVAAAQSTALAAAPPRAAAVAVFSPGLGAYACFRIPAIVASPRDARHLVAFAEGRRYSCNDHGYVDLVSRTSTDGGATWAPLALVRSESSRAANVTVGNPAPIVVSSDLLLLPFSRDNTAAAVLRSLDFGATWALSTAALPVAAAWSWVATGPPGGLALPSGRLVVPIDRSGPGLPFASTAFLSDDAGATWRVSAGAVAGGNEAQCAALPWRSNATLHLSARASDGAGTRLAAESVDGGATWSAPWRTVAESECEASVVALPRSRRLVLSSAFSPEKRQNMTLHVSDDDGRTFTPRVRVDARAAAYSALVDLSTDAGDAVGLLYEGGDKGIYGTILFVVVDVPATR